MFSLLLSIVLLDYGGIGLPGTFWFPLPFLEEIMLDVKRMIALDRAGRLGTNRNSKIAKRMYQSELASRKRQLFHKPIYSWKKLPKGSQEYDKVHRALIDPETKKILGKRPDKLQLTYEGLRYIAKGFAPELKLATRFHLEGRGGELWVANKGKIKSPVNSHEPCHVRNYAYFVDGVLMYGTDAPETIDLRNYPADQIRAIYDTVIVTEVVPTYEHGKRPCVDCGQPTGKAPQALRCSDCDRVAKNAQKRMSKHKARGKKNV